MDGGDDLEPTELRARDEVSHSPVGAGWKEWTVEEGANARGRECGGGWGTERAEPEEVEEGQEPAPEPLRAGRVGPRRDVRRVRRSRTHAIMRCAVPVEEGREADGLAWRSGAEAEPSEAKFLNDKLEPISPCMITLSALASLDAPSTLEDEPHRAELRSDVLEPALRKSTAEQPEPSSSLP